MMKLFKHVEGNHFKLNEDAPTVRKYRYIVSKIEEAEGLQRIIKFLVPYVVEEYNKHCLPHCKTDCKTVSMNLNKVRHDIGKTYTTDIIRYKSIIKLPGNRKTSVFRFITYKDDRGKLSTGFNIGLWNQAGYTTLDNGKPKDSYMW